MLDMSHNVRYLFDIVSCMETINFQIGQLLIDLYLNILKF